MIVLTGQLICTDEQQVEVVRTHLPEHIRLSRAEPGCLSFTVTQTDDPLIWQVDETFTDQAAFDAHQTRTKASAWFRASGHIQRRFSISS